MLRRNPDPYGYPRPAPGETNVPVATSFFFQIGFAEKDTDDTVLADSLAVTIGPQDGAAVGVLTAGQHFAAGYSGKIFPGKPGKRGEPAMVVYIDGRPELEPSTTYIVLVSARSRGGAVLDSRSGSWQFTTEDAITTHRLSFDLDLARPPIRWQGWFFTGFCKPSFCTSAANRIPGYELMERIRRRSPRAWSLQRDPYLTTMQRQPGSLPFLSGYANVVRERETRRIVAVEPHDDGIVLCLADFFGHQQYGIVSDRPLAGDYCTGDEVLIADGVHHARAKVLSIVADSPATKSLLVTAFDEPEGGWKLDYTRPLPDKEDPNSPGLFPPGGCYLSKFNPVGTPCYYWGRVDKEWDIAQRRFGRRLVVNFTDAPGDLSVDGDNWTFPKDYAQYHQVVRAYTTHFIERYGDACLDFYWSVFNEPDLAVAFWRSGDWNELQTFYDFTVDAVLRSFEDHGYDSDRVIVGGLEIGAIFGAHIEKPVLRIFLNHCSPRARCEGALEQNAAFIDERLNGQRSRRVEALCHASGGKGSPCDFVSVHSYNASQVMAAKLTRAKALALEIDADYYADLWVNSFESCPNWAPPPDVAAADSYLGNGYFPTWCADVARRQLTQAGRDARYGFGETILTFWPWPNQNFLGHNNATRVIAVDEDGDGTTDRQETVAMPILNFLGLVAAMGDTYWALPEQTVAGHVLSGFASKGDDAVRVLLYSHNWRDTQSRSRRSFEIDLNLADLPWPEVRVSEYRFDKDNNSYYRLGVELRDRPAGGAKLHRPDANELTRLIADLESGDSAVQIAAIKRAASYDEIPESLVSAAVQLYDQTKNPEVRAALEEAGRRALANRQCHSPEEVDRVRELSLLRVTRRSNHEVGSGGALRLPLSVAANGTTVLLIEPVKTPE